MQSVIYENKSYKIETRYSVEYISHTTKNWKVKMELLKSEKHPAPWTLYDVKEFRDLADAIEFFTIRLFDEDTLELKPMFEEIFLNGDLIRESYVDLRSYFADTMRRAVCEDTKKKLDKMTAACDAASEKLCAHETFLQEKNAENLFRSFLNDHKIFF